MFIRFIGRTLGRCALIGMAAIVIVNEVIQIKDDYEGN